MKRRMAKKQRDMEVKRAKKSLLLCIRKFKNIFTGNIRYNVYCVGDGRSIIKTFGKGLRVYKCKIYNADYCRRIVFGNSLKKPRKTRLSDYKQ